MSRLSPISMPVSATGLALGLDLFAVSSGRVWEPKPADEHGSDLGDPTGLAGTFRPAPKPTQRSTQRPTHEVAS